MGMTVASLLAGIALWPALEYALHRVLGHTVKFRNKFRSEHLKHHRTGDYFAAGVHKLTAALPSAAVLFVTAFLVLRDWGGAAGFITGFLCCYLFYEWTHKRFHTHPPRSRLGLVLRKHHMLHHFMDPTRNHGVTTRLFDRLFGTLTEREIVAVNGALAPRWLFDAQGKIAAEYRGDFRLL